jgi:hypothetical protein
MVSVQAAGCAPIPKAFNEGRDESTFWEGANTVAAGLRVPKALGDFLILKAVRESGGSALAVNDEEIMKAVDLMARKEGLFACPEGAATLVALERLQLNVHENLALFRENPEKYVPAYGGYCAWAVANGDLVKSDPEVWKIVDHRLYLNYSRKVQEDWEKDIPGFIAKAEANWPRLAAKN